MRSFYKLILSFRKEREIFWLYLYSQSQPQLKLQLGWVGLHSWFFSHPHTHPGKFKNDQIQLNIEKQNWSRCYDMILLFHKRLDHQRTDWKVWQHYRWWKVKQTICRTAYRWSCQWKLILFLEQLQLLLWSVQQLLTLCCSSYHSQCNLFTLQLLPFCG